MAVAGLPLRRKKAGIRRGRVRISHLYDAPVRSGAQGTKSLRQGGAQPGQEHTTLIAAITLDEGAMGESVAIEGAPPSGEAFERLV